MSDDARHTEPEAEMPPLPSADETAARPARRYVREWLLVVGVAIIAALTIRAFAFQAFRIPTPSMEKNLLVGDFVLVSKLHYGPRTPVTLGLPLSDRYVTDWEMPWVRLPGFSSIDRGDVVVFNYPVEPRPIDRKTHYIKRVVGLPGDTVALESKALVVNGDVSPLNEGMQQKWQARSTGSPIPVNRLAEIGAEQISLVGRSDDRVTFEATRALAEAVALWEEVAAVEPHVGANNHVRRIFPRGSGFDLDHYGPVYVPARGDTLHLNAENWPAYRTLIARYEGHEAFRIDDNLFEINGEQTTTYVVEQDYYFVMGDNRDSSSDSRTWGYVPKDHIVGKAVLIYFSIDELSRQVRLDRIFSTID